MRTCKKCGVSKPLEAFQIYNQRCRNGYIVPGTLTHASLLSLGEQHVLFFTTKDHWSGKSEIKWIEEGLMALPSIMTTARLKSIAIPPIGCGEGGLSWEGSVKPLILKLLADSDLIVELYDR